MSLNNSLVNSADVYYVSNVCQSAFGIGDMSEKWYYLDAQAGYLSIILECSFPSSHMQLSLNPVDFISKIALGSFLLLLFPAPLSSGHL